MLEERVTQNLTVVIDGGVRQVHSPFFYTPDPIVHDIKPLRSFFSGGRIVTVHGQYFDSVSNANLVVYDEDGHTFESSCHVYNARLMECKTPSIKKALDKRLEHVICCFSRLPFWTNFWSIYQLRIGGFLSFGSNSLSFFCKIS